MPLPEPLVPADSPGLPLPQLLVVTLVAREQGPATVIMIVITATVMMVIRLCPRRGPRCSAAKRRGAALGRVRVAPWHAPARGRGPSAQHRAPPPSTQPKEGEAWERSERSGHRKREGPPPAALRRTEGRA